MQTEAHMHSDYMFTSTKCHLMSQKFHYNQGTTAEI